MQEDKVLDSMDIEGERSATISSKLYVWNIHTVNNFWLVHPKKIILTCDLFTLEKVTSYVV